MQMAENDTARIFGMDNGEGLNIPRDSTVSGVGMRDTLANHMNGSPQQQNELEGMGTELNMPSYYNPNTKGDELIQSSFIQDDRSGSFQSGEGINQFHDIYGGDYAATTATSLYTFKNLNTLSQE